MNPRSLLLAMLIPTPFVIGGCGYSPATTGQQQLDVRGSQSSIQFAGDCGEPTNKGDRTAEPVGPRHPVRIATLQDKSGSSNTTRTAQLTPQDFMVPISILRCVGGELSVGILDDKSNQSLVRLRIEVPPTPPPPPSASNVFVRANQDADYQQRLREYNKDVEKWKGDSDSRVKTFLAQVAELLLQQPNAKRTSVWNAIRRADLMLNESDATWPQTTHRFAVLNSDCLETARTKPVQVKSGAQWIVVNGAGSVGVAEALKPELFENPAAAFEFIKAKELGGK